MTDIRFFFGGGLLLSTVLLSGCGMFSHKHDRDYLQSKSIKSITVPDGDQQPPLSHDYDIPPSSVQPETDKTKLNALEKPPAFDAGAADEEGLLDGDKPKSKPKGLNVREARNTDGYSLLVVEAKYGRAWDSVGVALKNMGFTVEDSDRGDGIYSVYQTIHRVMSDEEKFLRPRDDKGLREQYQIHLEDHDNLTRVIVRTPDGKVDDSDLAKHLLIQLRAELEHPKSNP